MGALPSATPGAERQGVRVGHKPSSVPMPEASVMIIPLGRELPHASSDLPGSLGRATLKRSPIWSCSGWGLPSQPGHPGCWWSLTPPFHPCLCRLFSSPGIETGVGTGGHWRSLLCGTVRRVTPPGRYPATRSVELGLSSGRQSSSLRSSDQLGRPGLGWRGTRLAIPIQDALTMRTCEDAIIPAHLLHKLRGQGQGAALA